MSQMKEYGERERERGRKRKRFSLYFISIPTCICKQYTHICGECKIKGTSKKWEMRTNILTKRLTWTRVVRNQSHMVLYTIKQKGQTKINQQTNGGDSEWNATKLQDSSCFEPHRITSHKYRTVRVHCTYGRWAFVNLRNVYSNHIDQARIHIYHTILHMQKWLSPNRLGTIIVDTAYTIERDRPECMWQNRQAWNSQLGNTSIEL